MAKAELFQKDIPKEERVFYYKSEEDDPIKTSEQEKHEEVRLPEGYEFIPKNPFVKLYSAILYRGFKIFARFYAKFYLHMEVYGREKLKKARGKGPQYSLFVQVLTHFTFLSFKNYETECASRSIRPANLTKIKANLRRTIDY